MAKRSAALLLLISLFAASQSASLSSNYQQNELSSSESQCAQTCTQIYSQVYYQPGKTYSYQVDLVTRIGTAQDDEESEESTDQEVKISAHADISAYGPCELVLKLRKVHLVGVSSNTGSMAEQLEAQPIHFAYEDGQVVDVCGAPQDDQWVVNVKKSIISALQMTSRDVSKTQTVTETDISGQCETIYEPLSISALPSGKTIIRKVKQMDTCRARHSLNTAFFPRAYGLDQVIRSSFANNIVNSNATNECTQTIRGQIVEQVECVDRTVVRPLGVSVYSSIKVALIEKQPTLAVQRIRGSSFRKHRLTMSSAQDGTFFASQKRSIGGRRYSINDVQVLLKQLCSHVQTSIQLDVPVLFHELTQSLHSLNPQQQTQLWEQIRSKELCHSTKLLDLFLDASALAGNEGSAVVLIQALQQQQISQSRANYLFGLLSFAKQPTVAAAQRLVQYIQQQGAQPQQLVQIPRGVLFGITGLVHNLQIVQTQSHQQNPQVDQLVQSLSTLLIQGVQQLAQHVSNQQQEHQALTVVYALRNLVLVPGNSQNIPQNQQIAQQLVQLLQQVPQSENSQEVRVAIVRTLVNAGINDQIRQYLVEHLIQNPSEGIEIQIEAYRAVVLSGASSIQLEQIKQYTDAVASQPQQSDLVNYIRSHQANLRTTSDPHKQSILPVNAPVFAQPSRQFFGISRNYELSYVNQGLGLGVTAETDVIYDAHQGNKFVPVPQTVSFNLTIPIGGAELQLVEVRLHQHGLEPVIAQHLRNIQRSADARDPWNVAKETVQYIIENGQDIVAQNPQVHILLQISIDGKTIVLIDEDDLVTSDAETQTFLAQLNSRFAQITADRAFAITPLDTVVQFSSVNGFPVQVRLNSTVVLGLQSSISLDSRDYQNEFASIVLYPSVAAQLETAVEFFAGPQVQKSVEYVQSFWSAPQLNLAVGFSQERLFTLKLELPESRVTLARWESQVYTRNEHNQRIARRVDRRRMPYDQDIHVCTQNTHAPLGVQLCYDFTYATPNGNSIDVVAEVYIVKTDHTLRTYELTIDYPIFKHFTFRLPFINEPKPAPATPESLKITFNTPGSQVNREMILDLYISELVDSARVRIQTPWKSVLALVSVRNEPKEQIASVEISIDEQKYLQMELALETIRRGQKIEYRPRLILAMDSILEQPINLAGTVTYSQGRKSLIHFNLEDVQQKRQYITGTLIRERGDQRSVAARHSADLTLSLIGLNAKVGATFELADRLLKLDLQTDYQLPSWEQKEQAKIAFKTQNLSSGKMLKLVNFGMVKVSQYPQYQVQYGQNLMYAAGEQFEHDLKLGWASEDDEQVRLYQAIKKTGVRGKIDIESQSIIVYRPQEVNYEVKATAGLVGFGINGQKRYNILVEGKCRDQEDSPSNFQAEFAYSHISKSPLKMKMSAAIKSQSIDLLYSDEIEEPTPNNYHGHLLLQLSPLEKYSTDYVYTVKSQGQRKWNEEQQVGDFQEHELNFDLKNSKTAQMWRHHGLLRMESPRSWMVRSKMSKVNDNDLTLPFTPLYDGEVKLDQDGKTNLIFNHYPKDIRAKLALDSLRSPSNGQFELNTLVFKHESAFDRTPAQQNWQFISKTKRTNDNENLLSKKSCPFLSLLSSLKSPSLIVL